jgi:hypothetical protein
MAVVLGGEGGVVVDAMEEPGGCAEHEEVEGGRGAYLDRNLFADAGQGAHR